MPYLAYSTFWSAGIVRKSAILHETVLRRFKNFVKHAARCSELFWIGEECLPTLESAQRHACDRFLPLSCKCCLGETGVAGGFLDKEDLRRISTESVRLWWAKTSGSLEAEEWCFGDMISIFRGV
jgi:hypothetical protein